MAGRTKVKTMLTAEERVFARRLHAAAIARGKAIAERERISADVPACFRLRAVTRVALAEVRWLRVYYELIAHFQAAKADRSPKGRDKGTLGSVHESGGPEGICPNTSSHQETQG